MNQHQTDKEQYLSQFSANNIKTYRVPCSRCGQDIDVKIGDAWVFPSGETFPTDGSRSCVYIVTREVCRTTHPLTDEQMKQIEANAFAQEMFPNV